jgi:hypothetical protein
VLCHRIGPKLLISIEQVKWALPCAECVQTLAATEQGKFSVAPNTCFDGPVTSYTFHVEPARWIA